jgi:hypothetical protein
MTYKKMNVETARLIMKNLEKGEQWQQDIREAMEQIEVEGKAGIMAAPGLKRAANKFHDLNVKWKKKAVVENQKARMLMYQAKDKGQWELHKHMKKEAANPLVALRRREKGPRGEAKGTISTSPKEIDATIRKVYGEIYEGNNKKGQTADEMAEAYMEEYDDFIFKQPEMTIEEITGQDVEKVVKAQKETAGGMDQWLPAEFKLLSKGACDHLAIMFNMIEGGAKWPDNTTVARAAFMAKEEESDMDPLDYRVLLMLSTAYRTYAKTRLEHLHPWVDSWALDEVYAGIEGQMGQRCSLCNGHRNRMVSPPRDGILRWSGRHLQVLRSDTKDDTLQGDGSGGHAKRSPQSLP